jgi:hypothetical protein
LHVLHLGLHHSRSAKSKNGMIRFHSSEGKNLA